MPQKLARLFATFFYVGDFPAGPGTLASAVGVLIYLALAGQPLWVYVTVVFLITLIGFPSSDVTEKAIGKKDPGCVVIDEVAGMLSALFLLPPTPEVLWTAFFLFRAIDMFKIYPMNILEAQGGGLGIMADDLFAGIYTNVVMQIAIRWAGITFF